MTSFLYFESATSLIWLEPVHYQFGRHCRRKVMACIMNEEARAAFVGSYLRSKVNCKKKDGGSKAYAQVVNMPRNGGLTHDVVGIYTNLGGMHAFIDVPFLKNLPKYDLTSKKNGPVVHMTTPLKLPQSFKMPEEGPELFANEMPSEEDLTMMNNIMDMMEAPTSTTTAEPTMEAGTVMLPPPVTPGYPVDTPDVYARIDEDNTVHRDPRKRPRSKKRPTKAKKCKKEPETARPDTLPIPVVTEAYVGTIDQVANGTLPDIVNDAIQSTGILPHSV